jgi:hypothetical protein
MFFIILYHICFFFFRLNLSLWKFRRKNCQVIVNKFYYTFRRTRNSDRLLKFVCACCDVLVLHDISNGSSVPEIFVVEKVSHHPSIVSVCRYDCLSCCDHSHGLQNALFCDMLFRFKYFRLHRFVCKLLH